MTSTIEKITILVPMKYHSERIPFKNLKIFAGKPLFSWVLKTLQRSLYVKDIYVDTDGVQIKDAIQRYFGDSIKMIDRPTSICGDYVQMNKIIEYDISQIEGDIFLQTHTTNPLVKIATFDNAIETYFENIKKGYDSLFSVTRHQARFYSDKLRPVNHNPINLIRTQDLPPMYEENSNFYIFSKESFKKTSSRVGLNPYFYEVQKYEGIDIDDEQDFKLAEYIFLYLNPANKAKPCLQD